ncbi:exodeoxyribonuclease VII large subunit [bacterium]|nr:exodeoxyribonuclease VII large subunit [bacterium]
MSDDAPVILSVHDLTQVLRGVVEQCFPDVWVAGEVSNLTRAGSGHLYFTLKDEAAQLKAVMWRTAAQRLKFDLRDGMEVIARGGIEVYPPRGNYQIVCQSLQPQGMGALELALRQLQEKLAAEGLFEPDRKRPLPRFPRRVALITSAQGAAVRDMLQVLSRRWPLVDIVVLPVAVQGDEAAPQIAAALAYVHRIPEVDVVITGRGGGSLEDLWAFNTELVARAIVACKIPVVSAVGHEIDVTIADLVADRRALTPSEAAELVVPSCEEMRQQLDQIRSRLPNGLKQRAARARLQLDGIAGRRCFTRPMDRIHEQQRLLDELQQRLQRASRAKVVLAQQQLEAAAAQLEALSPLGVLSRGYSLTKQHPDGELIRSVEQVRIGDALSTLLPDGEVISRVEAVVNDTE